MSKFYVRAGWDDAPHLSDDDKKEMLAGCEPHLREARSQGIPAMGAGQVYPVPERDIVIQDPVQLKGWWRRAAGMDVGWNATAVVWGAHDVDAGILYIYDCYLKGQADPEQHAAAISRRDPKNPTPMKIPIAIDPASKGRSQVDGKQLLKLYRQAGLPCIPADNSLESGIQTVYGMMQGQQLKILDNPNTQSLLRELRTYRRDEKGRIVNKNDYHLLDALRYLVMTGLKIAKPLPVNREELLVVGSKSYGV